MRYIDEQIAKLERFKLSLRVPGGFTEWHRSLGESKRLKWVALGVGMGMALLGGPVTTKDIFKEITGATDSRISGFYQDVADYAGDVADGVAELYQKADLIPRKVLFWMPLAKRFFSRMDSRLSESDVYRKVKEKAKILENELLSSDLARLFGYAPSVSFTPDDMIRNGRLIETGGVVATLEKPGGYYRRRALSHFSGDTIDVEELSFKEPPLGKKTGDTITR